MQFGYGTVCIPEWITGVAIHAVRGLDSIVFQHEGDHEDGIKQRVYDCRNDVYGVPFEGSAWGVSSERKA